MGLRGYPLKMMQTACAGALACGPGYRIDDSASSGEAESGGDGILTAGPTTASTSDGNDGVDDDGPVEECWPGDECMQVGVCSCNCDWDIPNCCECNFGECGVTPCPEGLVCTQEHAGNNTWTRTCTHPKCEGPFGSETITTDADVPEASGPCANDFDVLDQVTDLALLPPFYFVKGTLTIEAPLLGSLAGLEPLEDVGSVALDGNQALQSLDGLSSVTIIRNGGVIRNNPLLPSADIQAWLAGIEGGDAVMVCGNLDDPPC